MVLEIGVNDTKRQVLNCCRRGSAPPLQKQDPSLEDTHFHSGIDMETTEITPKGSTPKKMKRHSDDNVMNGSEQSSTLESQSPGGEIKRKKEKTKENEIVMEVMNNCETDVEKCTTEVSSPIPSSFSSNIKRGSSKIPLDFLGVVDDILKNLTPYEQNNDDSQLFFVDDCEVSAEDHSMLKSLTIMLHHEVPDSHLVERIVTKAPTEKERQVFSTLPVVLKTNHYNVEEDAIIRKNWEKFCNDYNIGNENIFLAKRGLSMQTRRTFCQYLGNGLPNRTLNSIYTRFRYLCKQQIKGRFSQEEDTLIKLFVENKKNPFCTLSTILKRDRKSIHHRYERLTEQHAGSDVYWDSKTAEEIVKALVNAMACSPDQFPPHIPENVWKVVAVRLNKPFEKIRHYWNLKLAFQLLTPESVSQNRIFINIIEWLHSQEYKHALDVEWSECAKTIPGANARFLWEMFRRLRASFPDLKENSFPDLVEALYKRRDSFQFLKDVIIKRLYAAADGSLSTTPQAQH